MQRYSWIGPYLVRQRRPVPQWKTGQDASAAIRYCLDDTGAAQLLGTLAHRRNSDSVLAVSRDPNSVIRDLQLKGITLAVGDPDRAAGGLCMPYHIGQGLHGYAINGYLRGCR